MVTFSVGSNTERGFQHYNEESTPSGQTGEVQLIDAFSLRKNVFCMFDLLTQSNVSIQPCYSQTDRIKNRLVTLPAINRNQLII